MLCCPHQETLHHLVFFWEKYFDITEKKRKYPSTSLIFQNFFHKQYYLPNQYCYLKNNLNKCCCLFIEHYIIGKRMSGLIRYLATDEGMRSEKESLIEFDKVKIK